MSALDNSTSNTATESIYPEFFKEGMRKLQNHAAASDLQRLFSALENFHRDIKEQDGIASILRVTQSYITGLNLFQTSAFYLVNAENLAFELALCVPEEESASLDRLVKAEIKSGKFAWALRKNASVFFEADNAAEAGRGVLYPLGAGSCRIGMFCALLRGERMASQEISFSLLSLLLGIASESLSDLRQLGDLKNKILAANRDLQRTLRENEVLAKIPAESPSPIVRLSRNGQILYRNQAAKPLLQVMGHEVNDMVTGDWLPILADAFEHGEKREFEASFQNRVFTFLVVAFPDAGYANFYGTEITKRKHAEAEREQLIGELQEALANVKTLSGLVPICAWCKKIRDDQGFWKQLESYIESRSKAVFSHGVCPECLAKFNAGLPPHGSSA